MLNHNIQLKKSKIIIKILIGNQKMLTQNNL